MQITLDRAALVKALDRVAKIVERRSTIPILSHVLLDAGSNLKIAATDLDMEARAEVAADVHRPGVTTVAAHMLYDIVRKFPDGAQVSLRLNDEATQVEIKSGRARFALPALPSSDFPDVAPLAATHRFTMPAKSFAALLNQVAFAISTEETRYYLNGIFMHAVDVDGVTKLRAVATDGHRMARIECPAPEGSQGMPGIILPRKAINEILRLAKDHDGDIGVAFTERMIRVAFGTTILTSKLIDGTYPDYQRAIPADNAAKAIVDRVAFMQAADRVATVSTEKSRKLKLEFADSTLRLSVQSPDAGDAADEVEIDYAAAPIEIGFNARYLHEILSVLDGDTCLVKLDSPGAPAIFTNKDGAPLLIVLMPMRV